MTEITRAQATTPERTQRPTTLTSFAVTALIAFGTMLALLGVAIAQKHTGGNADAPFAGAVIALAVAIPAAFAHDRRARAAK
ncbi:hypothetical protein ABZ671_18470 [Micromonospora sp. NPDC006766]|uniref:hypothetical protein n=1 Tax=Micromonospora sp. NPDC006766 TaxID=3154778 RepID=UPI003407FF13